MAGSPFFACPCRDIETVNDDGVETGREKHEKEKKIEREKGRTA